MYELIYVVGGVIILAQQIIHHYERKDLYSRIMSRNLTEYKRAEEAPSRPASAHKRVLDRWRKRRGGDDE